MRPPFVLFVTAGLLMINLAMSAAPAPENGLVERRLATMGTSLNLTIESSSRDEALRASEEAIQAIEETGKRLTTWKDGGELALLNRSPVGVALNLDDELSQVLPLVFDWSERTLGAFDPAIAPLVMAWDLRGAGRIPPPSEIENARIASRPDSFRLDHGARTLTRLRADAALEEGAWGKGWALDRAARRLEKAGARRALIDLGGQILATGGEPWNVDVADPFDRTRPVASFPLRNGSASTSGNSERARVVGGFRVGHILDPRTGMPATDFGSVTVAAGSALTADVLSTALFVLGPGEGMCLFGRLRSEGVEFEVLFLIDRGGSLDAIGSKALVESLERIDRSRVSRIEILPEKP